MIKEYFLRYSEAVSNDFVLSDGGKTITLLGSDIADWKITFVDTGLKTNVGQRLRAVEQHIGDDEIFLANYGDVLTDAPLDELIEQFRASGKVAAFLAVRPKAYTFHVVELDDGQVVERITSISKSDLWINGGYFIFRRAIFDYMQPGEELIEEPFTRLIERGQLVGYRYNGFWAPMDTLKDLHNLEAGYEQGYLPWAVWQPQEPA